MVVVILLEHIVGVKTAQAQLSLNSKVMSLLSLETHVARTSAWVVAVMTNKHLAVISLADQDRAHTTVIIVLRWIIEL